MDRFSRSNKAVIVARTGRSCRDFFEPCREDGSCRKAKSKKNAIAVHLVLDRVAQDKLNDTNASLLDGLKVFL